MKKRQIRKFVVYFLLLLVAFQAIAPIYWLFSTAFKDPREVLTYPPRLIPKTFTLENFVYVFSEDGYNMTINILNSLFLCIFTIIFTLAIAIPAAFAFSRFRFAGNRSLLGFLIGINMIPIISGVIPLFYVFSTLKLTNTLIGLGIAYVTMQTPTSVWLLKDYFDSIPPDLEEAAMVDGCSRFGALIRILLPIILPAISSIAILTFIAVWDEFLFSITLLNSLPKYTYTIALYYNVRGAEEGIIKWGPTCAASVIGFIPPIIIYLLFQKEFFSGLTRGALKE